MPLQPFSVVLQVQVIADTTFDRADRCLARSGHLCAVTCERAVPLPLILPICGNKWPDSPPTHKSTHCDCCFVLKPLRFKTFCVTLAHIMPAWLCTVFGLWLCSEHMLDPTNREIDGRSSRDRGGTQTAESYWPCPTCWCTCTEPPLHIGCRVAGHKRSGRAGESYKEPVGRVFAPRPSAGRWAAAAAHAQRHERRRAAPQERDGVCAR